MGYEIQTLPDFFFFVFTFEMKTFSARVRPAPVTDKRFRGRSLHATTSEWEKQLDQQLIAS